MHLWIPPDPYELKLRRVRQETLDDIAQEIENLYLKYQGIEQSTHILDSNINEVVIDNESMETDLQAKMKFHKIQQEHLKKELAQLNITHDILKTKLQTLESMRTQPRKTFSKADYAEAIRLLRDGNYKRSIHKFNETLRSHPPSSLKDNIRFGLGTAYYKLRKYSQAIDQFNVIIKHHPNQDKWHLSYVMLGMIHNSKGEKSKALYILNQALKSNPPVSIQKMIDRMMRIIQQEPLHVEG